MSIPEGYAKLAVIGIAWKGEYAADSVYHKMNGVCYEGSTYIALKDNPSGPPAHDGTNWQYLAKGFAEALMSACTATDTQGLVVEAGETTNAQTLMDSIADKVVTLDAPTFEDYTGETEVPAAAAALENIRSKGKVSTLFSNIKAFCKGCCTLAMIVNNCVTDNAGLPLSAAQGKVLMDMLNQLNSRYLNNAGAHNAIYRGKYLGSSVTSAQYAAISAGTFEDLYVGDYWVISGVTYRIAGFDYYLRAGDTDMTTHHVTLVPDAPMYSHVMNDSNVTTGGYVGSKMYTTGLADAKTTINNAFGSTHILTHRQYLCNAVSNGKPSGGSWYDSTVELMTEQNVYGGKVFGAGNDGSTVPALYTVDKSQYPLFAFRPDLISNRNWFWLRDVVSAAYFACVIYLGGATSGTASYAAGVRPAFSIKS